jgi:hypothetical protein
VQYTKRHVTITVEVPTSTPEHDELLNQLLDTATKVGTGFKVIDQRDSALEPAYVELTVIDTVRTSQRFGDAPF